MDASYIKNVVDDNLEYLGSLLQSEHIDANTRAEMGAEVRQLMDQAACEELKLAIFGEFSTGKSTFINAILGQDLLTANRKPTTQLCAYLRAGAELTVTATLADGSLQPVPVEQVAEYVSEQGIMKHARQVDIAAPCDALQDGLVIIDTPGINVDLEHHLAVTEEALREANACVFMMSARQPGTRTSIDYLKRISSQVDKFFLVLNMCDLLDEEELSEAVEYLTSVMRDECGIAEPRVYTISSLRSDGSRFGPGGPGFAEFLSRLRDFMQTDKQVILARGVARLQERVLADTAARVYSSRQQCEEELQRRWAQAMPDSETIVRKLIDTTKQDIASSMPHVRADAETKVANSVQRLRSHVEDRICSAQSKSEFKKQIPEAIQADLSSVARIVSKRLEQAKDGLFYKMMGDIDTHFDKLFTNVRNINLKLMLRDHLLYWLVIVLAVLGAGIAWLGSESGSLALLGALGGGLIGYLIFRIEFALRMRQRYDILPVSSDSLNTYVAGQLAVEGTESTAWQLATEGLKPTLFHGARGLISGGDPTMLIAGLGFTALLSIGGAIWDALFGPTLEDVKRDMRQKVAPILDMFDGKVQDLLKAEMNALELTLPGFCEQRIRQLDRRYETIVVELAALDRSQILERETRVRVLADIESELVRRSEQLRRSLAFTLELLSKTP